MRLYYQFERNGGARYALGLPLGFKRDKKYFSTDLEAVMFQAHDHVYPPLLEKIEYKRLPAV